MTIAYIGIGANQGKPLDQCKEAIRVIGSWGELFALRRSSFYKTEPHVREGTQAPHYINAVLEIESSLGAEELFERLIGVEAGLGRNLSEKGKWLPRPIDLDLLAYGDLLVETKTMRVPHPRLHERRFVLLPWQELNPDWRHPVFHQSIQDLLAAVKDDKHVERLWAL